MLCKSPHLLHFHFPRKESYSLAPGPLHRSSLSIYRSHLQWIPGETCEVHAELSKIKASEPFLERTYTSNWMFIKILFSMMVFYIQGLSFICIDEQCTQFGVCILLYEMFIMNKKTYSPLVWWYTPVTLAPRRMEQENHQFEPAQAADNTRLKEIKTGDIVQRYSSY